MFSIFKKIFGTANDRIIKKLQKEVDQVNKFDQEMKSLTDQELKEKTSYFVELLHNDKNKSLDDILPEAFAVVREASSRVLGLRHYDVQLIGGIILHRGKIAEMRTGEGKTLVATLPAYLNALAGKVHIVTVNDYLAERDSKWMGQVFQFLGLKVANITSQTDNDQRKEAYQSDIIYITNNELGFDYLRDNMKFSLDEQVQKSHNFAIIDEVDSILIDEARTPLIISGPVDDKIDTYIISSKIMSFLSKEDYEKDEKQKTITLTDIGINKVENFLKQNKLISENASLYDIDNLPFVHYVNQALKAHFMFTKDIDYIVKDNKLLIIDEFTGRVMDGRRYSDGLHQSLEAKENVPIQNENQTLASITFQNYFRMYDKIAGMTGTAMTEADEFHDIYELDVISLPTNKKIQRIDYDDEVYGSLTEKYDAILKVIRECHTKGQPVLVGTVSIEKSEEISSYLQKHKIKHNVLNAKHHEKEAHIIAQAGRFGAVTIATNMAGRGTDIVLGGNIDFELDALEAEFKNNKMTKEKYQDAKDALEANFKQEQDKVINAGGLYVIGTERHESRRIDNQLRGRSGRQGDVGSTKFFLSLEDDLMRIFASDKISGLLRGLGLKNGEVIKHPMITKALLKAQGKVEAANYDIRKNLLKFDNVMNQQRNIVYGKRREIMNSDNISTYTDNTIKDVITRIVKFAIKDGSFKEEWNLNSLITDAHRILHLDFVDKNWILNINGAEQEIIEKLYQKASKLYNHKKEEYGEEIFNEAEKYVLLNALDYSWKDHLHMLDHLRQGISLRAYGQKDPLTEYKKEAFNLFEQLFDKLEEKYIQTIFVLQLDKDAIDDHANIFAHKKHQKMQEHRLSPEEIDKYNGNGGVRVKVKAAVNKIVSPEDRDPADPGTWGKVMRNELCPCESGKKYKVCHGKLN